MDYGNVHCNGHMFSWDGVNFDVSPHEIADIIRGHSEWNGENIRLLACEAGKYAYGAAYEIAIDLGVRVLAPITFVHVHAYTGEMYVIDCATSAVQGMIDSEDVRTFPLWQQEQWKLFLLDE